MGMLNREQIERWYDEHDGFRFRPTLGTGESMTKQEFAGECDLNRIVKRYLENGGVPLPTVTTPLQYGDVSKIGELHAALERAAEAPKLFDSLPPAVKDAFGDPKALIAWISDPVNLEKVQKAAAAPPPAPKPEPAPAPKPEPDPI